MAISEFEIKKIEKELEAFMKVQRPPAHIRNELDLGYRIEGQSVEIFEVRPQWRDPSQKTENPRGKGYFREGAELLEDILATVGFEVARVRASPQSKVAY
ncbi:hypothetical protein ULG90_23265 [Halopseudomonas pachastrellae]|nr:hypothetical protein ULG90_23265 [Halopseudomonas pachastrellae]